LLIVPFEPILLATLVAASVVAGLATLFGP
jgi:hypothetical protein